MLASLLQFLRFADRRIARRCVKLEMMLKFFKDYMSLGLKSLSILAEHFFVRWCKALYEPL